MYHGVINIYKEQGYTSHDVVAKVRGICRQKKVGHTGTLDPDAEGVLPVCLGSGTKLCDLLTETEKEYVTWMQLGITTDTQDISGNVLEKREVLVSEKEIRSAAASFQGEYMQVPPMYSALKVNGRKLYELAREGKEVERKARPVSIHEIEVLEISEELHQVKMRILCSKGTYIRTLCADIGEALGCGGTMNSLWRTKVGRFEIQEAIKLKELETLSREDRIEEILIPVDEMFQSLPKLHVITECIRLIENGNCFLPCQTLQNQITENGQNVRVYGENKTFYGIYMFQEEQQCYKPVKMFLTK